MGACHARAFRPILFPLSFYRFFSHCHFDRSALFSFFQCHFDRASASGEIPCIRTITNSYSKPLLSLNCSFLCRQGFRTLHALSLSFLFSNVISTEAYEVCEAEKSPASKRLHALSQTFFSRMLVSMPSELSRLSRTMLLHHFYRALLSMFFDRVRLSFSCHFDRSAQRARSGEIPCIKAITNSFSILILLPFPVKKGRAEKNRAEKARLKIQKSRASVFDIEHRVVLPSIGSVKATSWHTSQII